MLPVRISSNSRGRRLPSAAVAALALSAAGLAAAPMAASAAAVQHATVLRTMPHSQVVLVAPQHRVFSEHLASGVVQLGFGSQISFRMHAHRSHLVRVAYRKASSVTFFATVRSVHGTRLQVKLDSHAMLRIHLDSSAGLSRGERVLLTESANGSITLHRSHGAGTATGTTSGAPGATSPGSAPAGSAASGSASSAGSGSGSAGGDGSGAQSSSASSSTPVAVKPVNNGPESTASGAIVSFSGSTLQLAEANGTTLSLTMPADAISYLDQNQDISICETANVSYHQGSGNPVVDYLAPTGVSSLATEAVPGGGTCATQQGDGGNDVVGTVTASSESSITLSVPGGGSQTFPVDPSSDLTDGFDAGSIVDVTYDPTSGNEAIDIEAAEFYTTGVASLVDNSGGTLDIRDALTGATDNFAEDDASYANLSVGNNLGVVYWNSNGQLQGDNVSDLTTGGSN